MLRTICLHLKDTFKKLKNITNNNTVHFLTIANHRVDKSFERYQSLISNFINNFKCSIEEIFVYR